MRLLQAYKFCPLCSGKLILKDKKYLKCSKCGHNLYNNPAPCNAVVLENEKGEIILVKRARDPKKSYWDLPGGFIEGNENLTESVKREIKEELNLDIKVEKIIGAYHDDYLFQGVSFPILSFAVSAKLPQKIIKAADDVSGYKFFPKSTVLKQKLAFKAIFQILSDYLKQTK